MQNDPINSRNENTLHSPKSALTIKEKSIKGGAVTIFSQATLFIIRIGSISIIAHLLTPQDFGMIAMVTAVTGFAHLFKDLGLSAATIQRDKLTHEQLSTMFWINIVFSLVIALASTAGAPFVAIFYNTPELTWVMVALSSTFIFSGMAIQHQALLTRNMRFTSIAISQVISALVGVLAAVYSASMGHRYWALVIQNIASSVSLLVALWLFSRWIPGLPSRGLGMRPMLKFGMNITSYNVINYFARNMDKILIGRFSDVASLGIYNTAYKLLMLPISNLRIPLTNVAIPAMSRLQKESKKYRLYFKRYVSILAFISMPIVVYMYVCSGSLIAFVLGDQWSEAVKIFKILAYAALIQPVSTCWGLVLVSLGKGKRYLWLGIINSSVVVILFMIGIQWGIYGVAKAYVFANYLLLIPSLVYAFRDTPIFIIDFFSSIYRPVLISLLMGLVCFWVNSLLVDTTNVVALLVCLAVGVSVYLFGWLVVPGGRRILKDYISYASLVVKNKTV
jgi:O-antigen/teichoic acid export membrane protein